MNEMAFISLLGVEYKRVGGLLKIVCPFHDDEHPSLVVYPEERGFCCYACGETGTWAHLYKTIKGCEYAEAYKALGHSGEYTPAKEYHPPFEFVGSPEYAKEIATRYEACQPLPPVAKEFLKRKKILEQAEELRWRWDDHLFKQSSPGAIVIPYREDGQVVAVRLRRCVMGKFEKPIGLRGCHARPFYLLRDTDTVYFCEGETDALSLYAMGCSVMATPGAFQRKCLNTMVKFAEYQGYLKIIACGDADPAGKKMNELVTTAAHALTIIPVSYLTTKENDINDAYVAGTLTLEPDPLAGAIPLDGWEAVFAKSLFSDKEEIFSYVDEQLDKETDLTAANLYTDSLSDLQSAWQSLTTAERYKFFYLKETMKLAVS